MHFANRFSQKYHELFGAFSPAFHLINSQSFRTLQLENELLISERLGNLYEPKSF